MSVTLFYRHQWVSRRYSSGKVGNDNLSAYSCATDPCAEKDKVQSSLARDWQHFRIGNNSEGQEHIIYGHLSPPHTAVCWNDLLLSIISLHASELQQAQYSSQSSAFCCFLKVGNAGIPPKDRHQCGSDILWSQELFPWGQIYYKYLDDPQTPANAFVQQSSKTEHWSYETYFTYATGWGKTIQGTSFQSQIPRAEIPWLSAGSLLQKLSQQGAIPTSRLMAGLIPQTAQLSLSRRHVRGKPDVLVCVSGTALGHCSQTLPWPNCTDVGGAAAAQGCAFLSS